MRILLTQLILLLPLCNLSIKSPADKVLISEVEFIDGLYRFDDRLVNGEIIDYYENETLKFRYRVLEGRLHGMATEFFKDGRVKSERHYNFNKLFGEFREYFKNGDLMIHFDVGHNAYGSGEKVSNIKFAKGKKRKLKDLEDGVIHFMASNNKPLRTSEHISILNQSKYRLMNKDGDVIFEN